MQSLARSVVIDEARRARRAVWLTALAALVFVGGTYLAPLLERSGLPGAQEARLFYAPVCHQDAGRSFAFAGAAQSVCARCSGLYWGGVVGLLAGAWFVVGRRRGPRPVWLACVLVPNLVDAALPWIGWPGLTNLPRHVIAWPLGLVAGLFLAVGVADLAVVLKSERARGSGGRVRAVGGI